MRYTVILVSLLAAPAMAQQSLPEIAAAPQIIDATKLTVEELMALARAERERPTSFSCCDWGGLGCVVHRAGG